MHAFTRTLSAALLSIAALAPSTMSAQADTATLMAYAGDWRGAGQLRGTEEGSLSCRLSMTQNGDRLNYSGRCTLEGSGSRSFRGVMAWDAEQGRYVVRSADGAAYGRARNGGVVFNIEGEDSRGSMTSTFSLTGGAISVSFRFVDNETQGVTESSINFSRG